MIDAYKNHRSHMVTALTRLQGTFKFQIITSMIAQQVSLPRLHIEGSVSDCGPSHFFVRRRRTGPIERTATILICFH